MQYKTLKPRQFINEYYPGSGFTVPTVINWMNKGLLPYITTPTGQRLVLVDEYVLMITARNELLE